MAESDATEIVEDGLVEDKDSLSQSESLLQAKDVNRKEVSAATIGRMMGLVTLSEFNLLEKKVDLMSSRVGNLVVKMDKVASVLAQIPTGSDLERIDVQIGALRTILKDFLEGGQINLDEKGKRIETSNDRVSSGHIISNRDQSEQTDEANSSKDKLEAATERGDAESSVEEVSDAEEKKGEDKPKE